MNIYSLLGDTVAALHVAYVGFVFVGQILILAGWLFGWRWTRNPWFRLLHLGMIGFVAFEEAINMRCPLTVWEESFRTLAGQEFSGDTFLSRLVHSLMFFDGAPWVFTAIHVTFAAIVMGTFILYRPRWKSREQRELMDAII